MASLSQLRTQGEGLGQGWSGRCFHGTGAVCAWMPGGSNSLNSLSQIKALALFPSGTGAPGSVDFGHFYGCRWLIRGLMGLRCPVFSPPG